jgi:hypothetical protein
MLKYTGMAINDIKLIISDNNKREDLLKVQMKNAQVKMKTYGKCLWI